MERSLIIVKSTFDYRPALKSITTKNSKQIFIQSVVFRWYETQYDRIRKRFATVVIVTLGLNIFVRANRFDSPHAFISIHPG
jgi:hypothetical protein